MSSLGHKVLSNLFLYLFQLVTLLLAAVKHRDEERELNRIIHITLSHILSSGDPLFFVMNLSGDFTTHQYD